MSIPSRIAVTGAKFHGKDTVVRLLREQGLRHETIRFADGLKEMLRAFYRVSGLDADTIERKLEGALKEVPCEHLGGKTPRFAMQTLGTEWRDMIWDQMWVHQAANRIVASKSGAMSPDMRFPVENKVLLGIDEFCIRVVRPSKDANESSAHISEQHIMELLVHAEIINDGSLADLAAKVAALVVWFKAGFDWPKPSKTPELVF